MQFGFSRNFMAYVMRDKTNDVSSSLLLIVKLHSNYFKKNNYQDSFNISQKI